jgi:hypothetical protein
MTPPPCGPMMLRHRHMENFRSPSAPIGDGPRYGDVQATECDVKTTDLLGNDPSTLNISGVRPNSCASISSESNKIRLAIVAGTRYGSFQGRGWCRSISWYWSCDLSGRPSESVRGGSARDRSSPNTHSV